MDFSQGELTPVHFWSREAVMERRKPQEYFACSLTAGRLEIAVDRRFLDTYCVLVSGGSITEVP